MGMWRDRQNVILKHKLWLFAFVAIVAFFEVAATYANHVQSQNIWKSVASLLRNEVNSANSYQISRALSDMEGENWIKCVKLTETSNGERIFYDTTTQSYCGSFAAKTEGTLSAINGSTWSLSFASPENIWFLVVRLVIPILVGFSLHYAYQIFENQRKAQEAVKLRALLEKDILLDLTKQTRHDIASPIGALKLVVQRIEVAPEYSEILQSIVDRIDGIFSQLKDVGNESDISVPKVNLEVVSLDKIVSAIITEKVNEWNLPVGTIVAQISPGDVIGNQIELGRIISNILNNAIEAKKEGEPLQISVIIESDKKNCVVRISDNGIGIDEEALSKVGSKGYSFGKTKENSGIGIYNAKKVIQSFGGELKIESSSGLGTTVSIYLKRSEQV